MYFLNAAQTHVPLRSSLLLADTVETQIFALQEYKLALAAKVLDSKESSKTDKGVFSNERLADLMSVMKQRSLETSQTQPLA